MTKKEKEDVKIAIISTDIGYIKISIDSINEKLDDIARIYVTQTEFKPVKSIVYGLTALVMAGVVSALIYTVIRCTGIRC